MTRNLKALGLALLAAFAMSAVGASAASAETTDKFTFPEEKTILTGAQTGTNIFFNTQWKDAPVTCKKATIAGTVVGKSLTVIKVHPTYEECTSPFGAATVDTEGCDLTLTSTTDNHTKTDGTADGKHATVSLDCTAGSSFKITVPSVGCTITMTGAQNQNLLGVRYTNQESGGKKDIEVDFTIDKFHYTSSFACQLGGFTATDRDGFTTQTVTVKGYKDNELVGPGTHQDVFPNEGEQVNIEVS